jgi:hypothetical protein
LAAPEKKRAQRTAGGSETFAEANEAERERKQEDGETEVGGVHGDATQRRRRALKER